jgi:hypothetical protein
MKRKTSFALSEDAIALLKRISEALGISQAAVLELLIRERGRNLMKGKN